MATFTKQILTESSDGRGILVSASSSTGTSIHIGPSTTSTLHEVWLYASNPDTADHTLTIEWGDTVAPDDRIVVNIAAYEGLRPIVTGLLLKGNASPLVIRAFADTVDKVVIHGYVNEIAA